MANGIHNIAIMETTTSPPLPKRTSFTHIRQGIHELMIATSFMVSRFSVNWTMWYNITLILKSAYKSIPLDKKRCVKSHTYGCHKTHTQFSLTGAFLARPVWWGAPPGTFHKSDRGPRLLSDILHIMSCPCEVNPLPTERLKSTEKQSLRGPHEAVICGQVG